MVEPNFSSYVYLFLKNNKPRTPHWKKTPSIYNMCEFCHQMAPMH